jgi:hypothetical protein
MGTFIFHSKYHKNAHHTVPTSGFPDSASDPVASEKYPFGGIFYNTISNNISTNSLDWANTFTTTSANSAVWDLYSSVFTTVRSNSGFWENNFSFYNTYNLLSANINSTDTVVSSNRAYWDRLYSDKVLFTDAVQEDTRQKNFTPMEINPNDISNVILDLSSGQVSYFVISNTSNISGFIGAKRGGIYHLYTTTDGSCLSTIRLNFNPQNFKFPSTYSFVITGTRLGKFQFFSDGTYLHGKSTIFDAIGINDQNTYFSGSGVFLDPNPYVFSNNEGVNVGGGLLVNGVFPYVAGTGVEIVYVPPCP